jgi:hypothetical protein
MHCRVSNYRHRGQLCARVRFAVLLLPFEPGTGNFTKIVQRLPVRIHFELDQPGRAAAPRAFGYCARQTGGLKPPATLADHNVEVRPWRKCRDFWFRDSLPVRAGFADNFAKGRRSVRQSASQ